MATLTITNLTSSPVLIQDIYASIPANSSIDVDRDAGDLPGMKSLQQNIADGNVSISIVYSAAEKASGLEQAALTVGTGDMKPASAGEAGGVEVVRLAIAAGGGGSPADSELYAADALPYDKARVIDAWMVVETAVAGTLEVRDAAAGGGNLIASGSTASTGRIQLDPNGDVTTQLAKADPLVLRRTDDAAQVEVFLMLQPEV